MALNRQIHIYSVDTGAFYNKTEDTIHRKMIKLRGRKNKLREFDTTEYDEEKQKKYRRIQSKINEEIKLTKKELKESFELNTKIRNLNEDSLNDKKVISVFESTLTRVLNMRINELTTDIIVVQTFFYEVIEQIIKNGFMLKGEKYKYLTSSAGQIRTKKTVFIKESLWDKNEKTLMCGLTLDIINDYGGINVNKFLAYLALSNSATDWWKDFDINKCIVVNDFETNVNGKVDFISDITYEIERKEMDVPIEHTDGCGMILPRLSNKNFMIRLPWVKGLLAVFDFRKFVNSNKCSPIIKDIYGREWNIIKDDIEIIFTKSQFKMHRYYKDWKEYQDAFNEHNCQAGICNMEDDYFRNATINYQMIQSLTDVSKEEIKHFVDKSKTTLYNLCRDKTTMLRVFGANKENENKNYYQQALAFYPELLQDEYSKYTLRQIKNSLVKKYKSAKLDINGKYTFLIPDLYAFCERLFMGIQVPNGLLNDGEIFCKLYENVEELDCLRSPHLYREHAVRNNVVNKENSKWFTTRAVYTSSKDLISKMLQFDNDGDKTLVVADKTFVSVAKRNMVQDNIVPLYYEMKKAQPVILTSETIYKGLNSAYSGGNIGVYSNNISKIWNFTKWNNLSVEEKEEALNVIKLLCMENNFVIDYAKTLYKPERPKNVDKLIKKYISCKLPHFFKYAKDKQPTQIEDNCGSVVDSFDKMIKKTNLQFDVKNFGRINYRYLMNDKFIQIDNNVIDKFKSHNKNFHFKLNSKDIDNVKYIIKLVKEDLVSGSYNENEICDMLIKYYFRKKSPNKQLLWECFGENILNNLKNSITENSIQCERCGERFIASSPNQKLCDDCSTYQPMGNKIIKCIDCGCDVEIEAKDTKSNRCSKCYKEYRKKCVRENVKKHRLNKKLENM